MVTRADAVHLETKIQRKRNRRRRRPVLSALRISDLNRLFRARYGDTLPNDDAGRDDLTVMAHHLVALPGNPTTRIAEWARMRAPWVSIAELEQITADAINHPRRWRADRLAWRLHLNAADRSALRITTIGAIDAGKGSRLARRRAQARARKEAARRAKGMKLRHEYESRSLARSRPWQALGMSRRSWYRKGRPPA